MRRAWPRPGTAAARRALRARKVKVRALGRAHLTEIPDLGSYDIIEISSSGGKDSAAQAAYVVGLCRAQGLLDRVVIVHADLGRVEWAGTRELVEEHAAHLGVRCLVMKRAQGDLLDQVRQLRKWPMPTQRYCTADHKRAQIHRAFTQLVREFRERHPGLGRPVRILNCVGLRAEESPARAKRAVLVRDKRASNGLRHVDVWLPVQHWTTDEVFAEGDAAGLRRHPAYAAGLPRASCVFCIFAPAAALRRAGRRHPELLAEYVTVEREIGHDFKRHLPIAQIAADIAAGVEDEGPIESWCM